MNNTNQKASRFREVILNGTWIANTNFKDQLNGLDWEIATAKVGSLNTIALLAQHVHYYIKGINNVFKGGALEIKDKYSFVFAPIESQEDWDNFLERFWSDAESFASQLEQMPVEKFHEPFTNEKYGSYLRNIDGMIEHSYYHLGQIVLIRKLFAEDYKELKML